MEGSFGQRTLHLFNSRTVPLFPYFSGSYHIPVNEAFIFTKAILLANEICWSGPPYPNSISHMSKSGENAQINAFRNGPPPPPL